MPRKTKEEKEFDKTKRPFPNTEEEFFLKNKNCSDRIYAYLLLKSQRRPDGNEHHRYLEKISNVKIAEALGISRNTVGTHMKTLKELGYIKEEGRYYLVPKTDYYTLIPEETLDFLLHYVIGKDKIIKLYIFLYDYFITHRAFIIEDIHKALGYSMPNGKPISNNSKYIRSLLMILSEAGLVKYVIKEGRNEKGAPIDKYIILMMRSHIDDKYKESYTRLKEEGWESDYWVEIQQNYKINKIN